MASAPAVMLNNARRGDRLGPRIQLVSTSESRATISVATCGPKSSTPAITKASETEIRASTDGTLMLKEPVRSVSAARSRSEEHTSELQSQSNLVCRLLLEKKNNV